MWNEEISDWELPPTTHPSVYLGYESEEEETDYEPSDWELMNDFYRRVNK